MEQITSSYNLFVDTSTGHNSQSKGDDFMVNLQDAGVHAGEGEFIRLTLNNFSMAKVFQDINDTNNKFKLIYDFVNPDNSETHVEADLEIDKGNYETLTLLAKNFGEKIRSHLVTTLSPIYAGVNNSVAINTNGISKTGIIKITVDVSAAHHIKNNSVIIQMNSDVSDSYVVLGGDRVRNGDDVTNSVENVTLPNTQSLQITCKYPGQRASMPYVYIRAPGVLNTNIETQGLRNPSDNHKSDVAHSDILGRAVVESSEWVQFTAQTDRDFFIDIHQKQLNILRLRLTDSKNRSLGRLAGGNTAGGTGTEQSTLGNLNFSAVIRFDIVKRRSVHHLETEHYKPPIPARFSEGNVPIKIRN